jgi:hypothetical protein
MFHREQQANVDHMWIACVTLACALAAGVVPLSSSDITQNVAGYMSLVKNHVAGERDASVAEMRGFQPAILSSVVAHLTAFAKELPSSRRIARLKKTLPVVEPSQIEVGGMKYSVDRSSTAACTH